MSGILKNCKSLTSISLSSLVFSNVNNLEFKFYGCEKLTSNALPIEIYYLNAALSISNMLINWKSLISIDLSTFILKSNSNISCMFFLMIH